MQPERSASIAPSGAPKRDELCEVERRHLEGQRSRHLWSQQVNNLDNPKPIRQEKAAGNQRESADAKIGRSRIKRVIHRLSKSKVTRFESGEMRRAKPSLHRHKPEYH